MRSDGEVTATDAQIAIGADALPAVIGGGQCDSKITACDVDVSVAFDGGAIGRLVLVVDQLQDGAARRGNVDDAARNVDVAVSLDAFRHVAGVGDGKRPAVNINKAVGLDAFAVRAARVEGKGTVVHGKNARYFDASLAFRRSVDGEIPALDGDVPRNIESI